MFWKTNPEYIPLSRSTPKVQEVYSKPRAILHSYIYSMVCVWSWWENSQPTDQQTDKG